MSPVVEGSRVLRMLVDAFINATTVSEDMHFRERLSCIACPRH